MAVDQQAYEVVVVGGGPAGLSTALYSVRLGHETALVDRGGGRAAMMKDVHNLVGTTEETSGMELLQIGKEQLEEYGCTVLSDRIGSAGRTDDDRFRLCGTDVDYVADAVALATGMNDVRPDPPLPRTGRGLHYCLHCDAHMFADESVYVMGYGESAAHVAAILLNFTDEVDLLTRGDEPAWSDDTDEMLDTHPIDVIHEDVTGVQNGSDGWLKALEFEGGAVREYKGGFALYGADYNSGLATDLGCELNDDGTVEVDDHGRTSVDGVYAIGDLTPGHNQVPIALGDGAKAGISIHWTLRDFPRDPDLVEEQGPVRSDEVPGMPDELLEQATEFHTYD
ncbi:NAD(P)/FAD-dependent oxidoreductase [Haloplanus rallus]|uniref:NAD(P)/FAD-dependent oxidoreductase n=1 Tax=Haloplanus rallus TaxID=1816183 RepID=A0A6B9F132_9EURY|nr:MULTISPECIES: NAD(P)/FAD-dependent oxidoreductase [Haloplanus]QGX93926.1 NAD(P)/FAD-dependent oxidoreductase [Haloplanus rallus]